jgi:pyruvate/2-oxoglutarate dehydrogenase complex dihydrolipoamide dehydrogenase (E3) component
VDLIMGQARFAAPNTVAVALRDGGTRKLTGERVVLSVGTRATIPDVPGLTLLDP